MQKSVPTNGGIQPALHSGVMVAAPGSVAVKPLPSHGPLVMVPSAATLLAVSPPSRPPADVSPPAAPGAPELPPLSQAASSSRLTIDIALHRRSILICPSPKGRATKPHPSDLPEPARGFRNRQDRFQFGGAGISVLF